jgi:hypothetical protein
MTVAKALVMHHWITGSCLAVAAAAHAEPPAQTTPSPAPDRAPVELAASRPGMRFFVGAGLPTLIAPGLGYHFATGTEISIDGMALAIPDAAVMMGEAVVNQDVVSSRRFDLHLGVHGAVQRLEGLEDVERGRSSTSRVWWLGPRLGVRVHREHGFIDLDAGYSYLRCRGDCADVPGASISAELKFGFAFWDGA